MRGQLAFAVAIALGMTGLCAADPTPPATSRTATEAALERAAKSADAVFEAVVVDAGRAPGVWSGVLAAYQTVTYRITKVVTAHDPRLSAGTKLAVSHAIVAKSATADRAPRLRPDLVHVGARVIVLARWSAGDRRWLGVDEDSGIVPDDAARRNALARP